MLAKNVDFLGLNHMYNLNSEQILLFLFSILKCVIRQKISKNPQIFVICSK